MTEKTAIDVCVATYKRPQLLRELLDSLRKQRLDQIQMRIIVIDNDSQGSARPVIERFQSEGQTLLIYDVEPQQGISSARNRALSHVEADFFAFVDDDEVVSSEWLITLFAAIEHYQADAVFGPVLKILPKDAPEWAIKSGVFRRNRRMTGTVVNHGATNNVLVRRSALGHPLQEFDPAFGLTGGGDTDYFYRLHLAGKHLIWCDEAVVQESVPLSRLTHKWVWQRGYRSGQAFARIIVSRYPWWRKALRFINKMGKLVFTLFALPVAQLFPGHAHVDLLARFGGATGELSVFFSKKYFSEYDSKRYRSGST